MKIDDYTFTNSDAEYDLIKQLLLEVEAHPEIDNNWDPSRMDYWRYNYHAKQGDDFFQANAHYWKTETNQVVGLFVSEYGKDDFFIVLHPNFLTLFSEVLNWGLNVWARGKSKITTDVYTFAQPKIEQLKAAGFREESHVENVRTYSLEQFDFSYNLKAGFKIVSFTEYGNYASKVKVMKSAFTNSNVTEDRLRSLQSAPTYQPDLDLVIVNPDGESVAFCTGWIEEINPKSGYIEPMGVHADYRKLGFGKALAKECFKRLSNMGVESTWIASHAEPDVSNFLYDALKPVSVKRSYRYSLKLEEKMEFTTRLYDPSSDDDVATCVAIRNAEWPDDLTTFDEWRHRDKVHDPQYFKEWHIFEQGGMAIAAGVLIEPSWMIEREGKLNIGLMLHPDHAAFLDTGYDWLLAKARSYGATVLLGEAREDKTGHVNALEARGFIEEMRYPMSELVLDGFDFATYAGLPNKLASKGIVLMSLTEYIASGDPNYMRKLYDLECTIAHDVPSPEPWNAPPFEQYEQRKFAKPSHNADAWFLAIDTKQAQDDEVGALVGMSYLQIPPAQPHKPHTGLTGVLREYRRMGIATALKMACFRYAVDAGAERIETDNEENNPMYDLNMQLGFTPLPAWIDYKKMM